MPKEAKLHMITTESIVEECEVVNELTIGFNEREVAQKFANWATSTGIVVAKLNAEEGSPKRMITKIGIKGLDETASDETIKNFWPYANITDYENRQGQDNERELYMAALEAISGATPTTITCTDQRCGRKHG